MDDLISRKAAIEEIKKRHEAAFEWYHNAKGKGDEEITARAESAVASFFECALILKNLPAAQERKRKEKKRGKWVRLEVNEKFRTWACSKCGHIFDVVASPMGPAWNYCPECGTEMEDE